MTGKTRREYGSGSISQRKDGRWTGRVVIGLNENGNPKVKAVYGNSEAEVKKKLKALKADLAKNDYINVQRNTVGKYMTEWLTTKKRNELKATSYDRLEVTVNNQIIPFVGDIQLQAFSSNDVQTLLNTLMESGYSYSTIKKVYDAINECFRTGIIARTVAFNPALAVSLPSKDKFEESDIKFFVESEVSVLYLAARKEYSNHKRIYRLGELVVLVVNTGLRSAELLALKWTDVHLDCDAPYLEVKDTRVVVKDRAEDALRKFKVLEQNSAKSRSGKRSIPLNSDAVEALRYLKSVCGNSKYVIATSDGKPIGQRYLDRLFRNIQIAAGFPEERIYGIHSLRHTFATLLIKNRVDIKTVSELLGHSDVTITLNTYVHFIEEVKRQAVEDIVSVPQIVNG